MDRGLLSRCSVRWNVALRLEKATTVHFTKTILTETRNIRGAFSGISRAFGDIDKAIEAGDMATARLLLRRVRIALESARRDETPASRGDKDRSGR